MICTSTGFGKGSLRHAVAGAGLERKHRVVAGRAGVEQVDGTEVGLIARQREAGRRAVQPCVEIGRGVERQQHRHRTAPDAGEDLRGHGVQLHQRRHRTRIGGAATAVGRENVKADATAGWVLISERS